MRIAAIVLGILGSLTVLVVGLLWTDNSEHLADAEAAARIDETAARESAASGRPVTPDATKQHFAGPLDAVSGKARASYPMVGVGLIAMIASCLAVKPPKASGVAMSLAVAAPAVLNLGSLLVSVPLVAAAVLALAARPRANAATT